MKKEIILSFVMMMTFSINAQIRGVVIDKDSIPVVDVEILIPDYDIKFYTNYLGEFSVEIGIDNRSHLYFYKDGYESKISQYKEDTELVIILDDLHVDIDEISVTASYNILGNSKVTNIQNLSIKDVFLNSNSMIESITELSGVDIISSGIGIQKVVVRGLSGMRVVTYLNGMQINNQQWANDHGIGFTDLGLDKVELIKGSSALRYGSESIGGLLYFKDHPFIKLEGAKGYLASKFNSSSYFSSNQFGLKWNKNNLFFNMHGQYSISSDYRLPNNKYLFNSRFKQNSIKFSVAHKKNNLQNIFRYQLHNESPGIPGHVHGDLSTIELTQLLSSDIDFNEDFKITRPNQFVTNQLFIYESNYFLDNSKISLYLGHFRNNLQEYEKWTAPAFNLTLSNTLINPNIKYSYNNSTIELGSQFSILNNVNNINERLVPNASSINIGPYGIFNYEKDNLGVNLGIRYDYKNLKSRDNTVNNNKIFDIDYSESFNAFSISSGVFCEFKDHIIRISYSGASRTPHFSELFSNGVHHGTNRYEIGDEDLLIENANQIDLKYQWSNEHLGVVINPFIQHITNFISISPTDSFSSVYRIYNYMQYELVQIKGIEMNIHYHPHLLHNLHIEQSYSFLNTRNKDDLYGLALTPANSVKTKLVLDLNQYQKLTKFKINNLSVYHIHKFQQNSFAQYEEFTASYDVINLQLGGKFNNQFEYAFLINNVFNKEYTPHISRLRGVAGGVPNPGRSFSINLKYNF